MTRDEVINRILGRTVRRSSDSAGDFAPALVDEINIAQEFTFERGYPKYWFLLDIATITVDATGYKAALPANFLELFEEDPAVLLVPADGSKLQPLEVAGRSAVEWGLSSPNTTSAVSVMEGYLLFATQLTVGLDVRILYYKKEPLNTSAYGAGGQPAANRWLQYAADLLIGEVGRIFAGTYLKDKEGVAVMDGLFAQAKTRLVAENTSRKEAARQRFVNGNLFPIPEAPRTVTATT